MTPLGIHTLGGHKCAADANRRELVAADPSVDDFLDPGCGVEPPAAPVADERHRKRPFFVTDDEDLRVGSVILQPPRFSNRHPEHFAIATGGVGIRRIDQLLHFRTEDRPQVAYASRLGGGGQRTDRFFGRFEGPLTRTLRARAAGKAGGQCRARQHRRDAFHDHDCSAGSHRRLEPPLRELLLLRWPRSLADRSDRPLE